MNRCSDVQVNRYASGEADPLSPTDLPSRAAVPPRFFLENETTINGVGFAGAGTFGIAVEGATAFDRFIFTGRAHIEGPRPEKGHDLATTVVAFTMPDGVVGAGKQRFSHLGSGGLTSAWSSARRSCVS